MDGKCKRCLYSQVQSDGTTICVLRPPEETHYTGKFKQPILDNPQQQVCSRFTSAP